jgi:hypothetical protein
VGAVGLEIPSHDTVQIASKVTGLEVSRATLVVRDVASSPRNDSDVGSADVLYDDGQTPESLVGAPFVDPRVANY